MSKKNKFHFLVYLAGLSIVGFLATDMYLPAFDKIHLDLQTSKSLVGLSLTVYLGGYALAQLLWGPISDKFGKVRAIIWGLSLFAITSIGLAFIQNIYLFLFIRIFQAIGACSAAVCWQALVIERYSEEETNQIFASIMPLVALSPALAPLAGAFILNHWGWEQIFTTMALVSLLLIGYSFFVPKQKKTVTKASEDTNYFQFLKSKKYLGNVFIFGFCSAGFFAWLTGAPFFLKELGYDENAIGWSFVPQTIAFLLGGFGYRSVAKKVEGTKILPYLLFGYAVSMFSLLVIALTVVKPTLTLLLIPFCIMAFTNGATYPIVVAEALKSFKENSGKAAALQNFIQLGFCFLASALVSAFSTSALLATCVVMALTVPFVGWGFLWSKQKN